MPTDVSALIEKAKAEERILHWLQAARLYEEAAESKQATDTSLAEAWERVGFCCSMSSRQAKDVEEFKRIRQMAVEAYRKAAQILEKGDSRGQSKSAQCYAFADYVGSWLASEPTEKRRMLKECCRRGKQSLEAFRKIGNRHEYGRTCNLLLLCVSEALYHATNWNEIREYAKEGTAYGKEAVDTLSKTPDKSELLQAYSTAALHGWYAANAAEEEEERKELVRRILNYSEEALRLAEEVGNDHQSATANWAAALCTLFFTEKSDSALEYADKMLEKAEASEDNYLKGIAYYVLAFINNWTTLRESDPSKQETGHRKIIECSRKAVRNLRLTGQDMYIAQTYLYCAESYSALARDFKANSTEKEATSRKAVDIGRRGLKHANRSGSADATVSALHGLSKALHFHSNQQTAKMEKSRLLKEALAYRREYNRIVEELVPGDDWIAAVGKFYESLIESELAQLELSKANEVALLSGATEKMEQAVALSEKAIKSRPIPARVAAAARFQDELGETLNALYSLTGKRECLSEAIGTYELAANNFFKTGLPGRAAESYWKVAKAQDELGNHGKAAENFEAASRAYISTAEKIPHLDEFFKDHATYMQAWSCIENAKNHHALQEYDHAQRCYQKAANLHQLTKFWRHLASNYRAWSELEQAESLSRTERSQEAIEHFKQAVTLFRETKQELQIQSRRIEMEDEKNLAGNLVAASDARRDYCLGRIALEEARILETRGDTLGSSERYGVAADVFSTIIRDGSEQTRKELAPIALLCQAWQKMMMAETRSSSELFVQAAEMFQKAQKQALDQRTRSLATANSSFCRALEAGTKFESTRDLSLHATAVQHLENAANQYLNAGSNSAFGYVKATQRLFNAYVYLDTATRETNPDRKARYYSVAEKVLENSAELYRKAKHPERSEQISKLAERAREEKKLAISLSEILHAPSISSSTTSFTSPTPTEENAVGLQKFERANMQANWAPPEERINILEELKVKIRVTNVGKKPFVLTGVQEIVPKDFDLVQKPDYCRRENSNLSVKGKRVDPLNTEELELVLRPFSKGTFEVRPTITCIGEDAERASSDLKPVSFKVEELLLPNRLSTGCINLDRLLLGGIPTNYTLVLTSHSCNERDLLVSSFLEEGIKKEQITFLVTTRISGLEPLLDNHLSHIFICNPKAESLLGNRQNATTLRGLDGLTDICIALSNAIRALKTPSDEPKRACIEVVSDVLLQHHAVSTRTWLNTLIPELRANGFTTLAIMNPHMHSQSEVQAVLDVFEGEICISEKETDEGQRSFLKVKRMFNQKYLEVELPSTRIT